MVDTSVNGALLSNSYNETYEILDKINNNYQQPSTIQVATRGVVGVHNVDALTTLSAQVTSLINIVKAMITASAIVNQIVEVCYIFCGEDICLIIVLGIQPQLTIWATSTEKTRTILTQTLTTLDGDITQTSYEVIRINMLQYPLDKTGLFNHQISPTKLRVKKHQQ